jgi:hypothetical protein
MKRTGLFLLLVVFLCQSQFVLAEVVVAPGAQAATEGSISNFYPFGMDGIDPLNQGALVSQRYQQDYDASLFSGYTAPLTISRIAFRPDFEYGSAFTTNLLDIQINMSTTPLALGSLTGVFANNIGSNDMVVVNRGMLTLSSGFTGPAGGPKDFDIFIDLDTPFIYDPTAGNLLMDVRNYLGQADKSIFPVFDAEFSPEIWRAWTTNPDVDGVNSPSTPYFGAMGLVTQFTFTQSQSGPVIPAPPAVFLGLLGAGIVTWVHKRRTQ